MEEKSLEERTKEMQKAYRPGFVRGVDLLFALLIDQPEITEEEIRQHLFSEGGISEDLIPSIIECTSIIRGLRKAARGRVMTPEEIEKDKESFKRLTKKTAEARKD